eukprot:8723783-Lingulodinium_polyedra.AAC.1
MVDSLYSARLWAEQHINTGGYGTASVLEPPCGDAHSEAAHNAERISSAGDISVPGTNGADSTGHQTHSPSDANGEDATPA